MRTLVSLLCVIACLIPVDAAGASPHHRSHRTRHAVAGQAPQTLDLSPITVQPFVVPAPAAPGAASFDSKMNLEDGVLVKGTRWIEPAQVTSRDLFILDITQSLEGGFDSVNIYDKGIASWGIMQWSAREGSLGQALIYIKRRLLATHQANLWNRFFAANGLDVNSAGLVLYGKPVDYPAAARLAFRGTIKTGRYDPNLAGHWASVLARAGRQSSVQALETQYASRVVDDVLQKRLADLPYHSPGRPGLTAADLADNDPYTEALVFALWTNNPRHAFEYVENAARATRAVSMCDDPAYWARGAFSDALLRLCLNSHFGNWQERAAMIQARAQTVRSAPAASLTPFEAQYQTVLAERKSRRFVEIASRHTVEERGVSYALELARIKQANSALAAIERQAKEKAAGGAPEQGASTVGVDEHVLTLRTNDTSLSLPILAVGGLQRSVPSPIAPP